MNWQILEIHVDGELITHVRYKVDFEGVESEGYCYFEEPKLKTPLADVTEEQIASWVRDATMNNGVNAIELRIKEQLAASKTRSVPAPWMPQVFTLKDMT